MHTLELTEEEVRYLHAEWTVHSMGMGQPALMKKLQAEFNKLPYLDPACSCGERPVGFLGMVKHKAEVHNAPNDRTVTPYWWHDGCASSAFELAWLVYCHDGQPPAKSFDAARKKYATKEQKAQDKIVLADRRRRKPVHIPRTVV